MWNRATTICSSFFLATVTTSFITEQNAQIAYFNLSHTVFKNRIAATKHTSKWKVIEASRKVSTTSIFIMTPLKAPVVMGFLPSIMVQSLKNENYPSYQLIICVKIL